MVPNRCYGRCTKLNIWLTIPNFRSLSLKGDQGRSFLHLQSARNLLTKNLSVRDWGTERSKRQKEKNILVLGFGYHRTWIRVFGALCFTMEGIFQSDASLVFLAFVNPSFTPLFRKADRWYRRAASHSLHIVVVLAWRRKTFRQILDDFAHFLCKS